MVFANSLQFLTKATIGEAMNTKRSTGVDRYIEQPDSHELNNQIRAILAGLTKLHVQPSELDWR